jgi:hypothetical protein
MIPWLRAFLIGFYNRRASSPASKTKQNPSKNAFYAWICLVESGLFKGLQGKKTKIISRPKLARQVVALRVFRQSFSFWRARHRPSSINSINQNNNHTFCFCQLNSLATANSV